MRRSLPGQEGNPQGDLFQGISIDETRKQLSARVRIAHTVAWAFFVGCILAIPVYAWRGEFGTAAVLIAVVFVEVFIILANRWRCPLTDIAARYTDARTDNFDIYLPLWLARYNKQIFGSLFFGGLLYTLARWQGWIG